MSRVLQFLQDHRYLKRRYRNQMKFKNLVFLIFEETKNNAKCTLELKWVAICDEPIARPGLKTINHNPTPTLLPRFSTNVRSLCPFVKQNGNTDLKKF